MGRWNELTALIRPADVVAREFEHRPVAAPGEPFGAEGIPKAVENRGQGLGGGSARKFGQEAGELARHVRQPRQQVHLLGPEGRSEERRVGKECRSRWSWYQKKKEEEKW